VRKIRRRRYRSSSFGGTRSDALSSAFYQRPSGMASMIAALRWPLASLQLPWLMM
jgi:hypothetical protein